MRGKYRGEQDVGQDRVQGGERTGAGGIENFIIIVIIIVVLPR